MSHVRQQLRDTLAATLTGLATTGASVYVNRAKALAAAQLPALVVRVGDESIEPLDMGWPGTLARNVRFDVEALASGAAAADTLDTVLAEVEVALTASWSVATLGDRLKMPLQLEGVEVAFEDETNPPLGSLIAGFVSTYHAAADVPGTAI